MPSGQASNGSAASSGTLLGGGAADQVGTPPPAGVGHNGGPDWRAVMAGEDAKALEQLARFKTPSDFLKSHNELRSKLSERPAAMRLAENATPEQIAEYRKGQGLPEISQDAAADVYMAAYKIELPKGYEPGEVERGLIGDYAKAAYAAGMDPATVKQSVNFFANHQQNLANARNTVSSEKAGAWQSELKSEWGRDYDVRLSTAAAAVDRFTGGDAALKNQLLQAEVPGGGRLGDHPAFAKLMFEYATANGMTDRIEAAAMESNGRSIPEQVNEVFSWQRSPDASLRQKYAEATQPGGRLSKLIAAGIANGSLDELGNPTNKRRSA